MDNGRMKSAIAVLWIVWCVLNVNNLHAQTIINDLQSQKNTSDGVIRIDCDSSVVVLIGKPNGQVKSSGSTSFVERNGFRIQAVMGKDARAEANSKQSAIQTAFPELDTEVRFESPNWRLLVGNFSSREDAKACLVRLQKEFPQFGKEMYVVTDRIKIYIER